LPSYEGVATENSFIHTRAYPVTAGEHHYYAVGHIWAIRNGAGFGTVNGKLTVEFYPNSKEILLDQHRLNLQNKLTESPVSVHTLKVNAAKKGKVLVSVEGKFATGFDEYIYYGLNNSVTWPEEKHTAGGTIFKMFESQALNIYRTFEVTPGEHEFHILAKKTIGEFDSNNNYLYASMTAIFYPDEATSSFKSERFDNAEIKQNSAIKNIAKISFNAPSSGSVILQTTGNYNVDPAAKIKIKLSDHVLQTIEDEDLRLAFIHEKHEKDHFSFSRVWSVKEGQNEFYLYAGYDDHSGVLNDAQISGLFTLKFVGDPKTTTGTKKQAELSGYDFFPNPAQDKIYYRRTQGSSQKQNLITLFDINGNKI
jgi:hypothetical protein